MTIQKQTVSVKTSKETRKQISDLVKQWGDNKSQVIIRCIDRVWVEVVGSKQKSVQGKEG